MDKLTDIEICQIAGACGLGTWYNDEKRDNPDDFLWFDGNCIDFARAVIKANQEKK